MKRTEAVQVNPLPHLTVLPRLPAPTAQTELLATHDRRRGMQLKLPASLLGIAQLSPREEPLYAIRTDAQVLVCRADLLPARARRTPLATLEHPRANLDTAHVPLALCEGARAFIGPGYVLLSECAHKADGVPALTPASGKVVAARFSRVHAKLPAAHGLAWRPRSVGLQVPMNTRFCDVSGRLWELAGFELGEAYVVEKFDDGVRFRPPRDGEAAHGLFELRTTPAGLSYIRRRLGEQLLEGMHGPQLLCVAAEGALYVVDQDYSLAHFGLQMRHKLAGNTPVEPAELARKQQPRHTCEYARARKEPRLQVQGSWLREFGFVPGARFTIEAHPSVRGRLLARLHPEGEHKVTRMNEAGVPKLYVPMRLLGRLRGTALRVHASAEGLQVIDVYGPRKSQPLPLRLPAEEATRLVLA